VKRSRRIVLPSNGSCAAPALATEFRKHGRVYEERASIIDGATAWLAVHDGPVRVLPDGCMDLLWLGGRLAIAGPDEVAHVHGATVGERVAGVRFRPGVLPTLLGVPAEELVGQRVPLADVVDTAPWRRALDPDDDPLRAGEPTVALEALLGPALRAVESSGSSSDHWGLVVGALERGVPVAELARSLGYSERQLSRRCRQHIGYGPAHLRRVLRLQRALALRRDGVATSLSAALAGYSDASHLHRDVRELAGVPLSQVS
jgi:AraC-like DNA-binding protein